MPSDGTIGYLVGKLLVLRVDSGTKRLFVKSRVVSSSA
jgi:hypothetical protein